MNLKIRKTKNTTIRRIIINLGSTSIMTSPTLYSISTRIIITTSPYLTSSTRGSGKKIGMGTRSRIRLAIMCRILKLLLSQTSSMAKRRVLFWLSSLLLSVWSMKIRKIMFPRPIPYLTNRDRDIQIWLRDKRSKTNLWFQNRCKRRRVVLQIKIRFNISQNLKQMRWLLINSNATRHWI